MSVIDLNGVDSVFYYSEDSPTCLCWKEDRFSPAGNMSAKAGSFAGSFRYYKSGEPKNTTVFFKNKQCYVGRIVFTLFNGIIQDGMIVDHIDGNPHNNKIENLRSITLAKNARNMRKFVTNTTGITGVCYTSSINSWRAIWHDGKGAQRSKSFSVNKYGFEIAKQLAIDCRNQNVNIYNQYTERHGK